LTKTCVEREFGALVWAKVTKPGLFDCLTGSSWMLAFFHLGHRRVAVDPELDHEAVDHAEEAGVVEEAGLHEVVEAVGGVGRPVAVHLDDEVPLGARERGLEDVRRRRRHRGWMPMSQSPKMAASRD
jgi:hypothetical protein